MNTYLGNTKVNIRLNGVLYAIRALPSPSSEVRTILKSSDGYILKSVNGIYLKPKMVGVENGLLTSEGYILKDVNDYYLTIQESD